MRPDKQLLEVVFYSGPAPRSLATLTLLGLLFDRVHFPNVSIPFDGFDPEWVVSEIQRIEALGFRDYDTWLLLQLMRFALHPELREFCDFAGADNQVFGGDAEKGAVQLVNSLYQQMFPPKPGFTPIFKTGHSKGLPYTKSINYPGTFYYQANALLYAGQRGIPIINDDPRFPVPTLEAVDAKHNAKLLATIMAMECVKLVLPEIGELQPEQIVQAREDLAKFAKPFRNTLLRLASQLNAAITATSDHKEIAKAAEFIATTEVYPALSDLKDELEKSKQRGWISRTWDLTKRVPELVAEYSAGAYPLAVPRTIAAFGSWFIAGITEEKPRSGLHFLLKLQQRAGPQA